MDINKIANRGESFHADPPLGEQSGWLYGGPIRPIKRDRYGEVVDGTGGNSHDADEMLNLPASEKGRCAIHGEKPPAISRDDVLEHWGRIWRMVLSTATPLQVEALRNELARAES